MRTILCVPLIFVFLLLVGVRETVAEEIVISANGSNSQNTITITTSSQTSVEQTNNANIENTVENTANTGQNSASDNTGGDAAISTGDITSETSLENSGNVSVVDALCCPTNGETTITIAGNGENSENLIDATKESSTTVTITQIANIANNITTNANTGGNSANSNTGGGSVSIDTGNIAITEKVENTFINLAHIAAFQPGFDGDVTITISNNGDSSENSIFPKWFRELFIEVDNTTSLANFINTTANTGNNSADGNSSDVAVTTGDITIGIALVNGPINMNIADVSCCPKKEDGDGDGDGDEEEKPPVGGPPPPSGGGNGGNGNGGGDGGRGGDVAAALGAILPVTGFNWLLATIANVLMFLFGLYLRRRSGNSPGIAYLLAA